MFARICLALATWLCVVPPSQAATLFSDSFESPDTTGRVTNSPAGWVATRTDKTGINDASISGKTGVQFAFLDDYPNTGLHDGSLTTTSSILSSNLTAWVNYTLTCDVAVGGSGAAGAIDLLAGTNVIASVTNKPSANNTFAATAALPSSTSKARIGIIPTDSHPYLGQPLSIRLRHVAGAWNHDVMFDNLVLDATDTSSDTNAPTPDAMLWHGGPVASANTSITMTAAVASDPNRVQYMFTNTVNGNCSGWIDANVWTDTGLTDGVSYIYKVKARDNSANYNETAWSDEVGATASAFVLLYDSFESPPHADVTSSYATNSQGWVRSTTLSGAAGLHDEGAGTFVTPYGSQAAFVYDNVGTLETRYTTTGISAVLEAGITYTITFNAASENGGNAQYGVDLLAGTNVIASATGAPGNDDVSATSVTITYVAKEGDSLLGNTIAIRLRKPYGEWSAGHIVYDNVRLMALPSGYSPASDGGGVSYDFVAAPLEVTVDGYVGYLNAMTNGELSVDGGEVSLVTTSNLLCLTTDANADAYVSYDSGAAIGSRFSSVTDRGDHPMIFVSWFGAAAYCNWKSSVEGLDAVYNPAGGWSSVTTETGYRLPTEAEWYKAAAWNPVAGRFHAYGTSSDAITTNDANFLNSGDAYEGNAIPTTPVGSYAAVSPYVLFDMSGNVGEWCNELYSGSDAATDPHVIRGGGWGHPAGRGKSSARTALKPGQPADSVGFRVFKTVRWE